MLKWSPTLITELAERRVVIFVGAGISKAAHAPMPSWSDLLSEMSGYAPQKKDRALAAKLIRSGRLLDAAELVNSLLPPANRRAILESKFKLTPAPTSKIYDDILALDPKVCITTNYDQLIEKNFEYFSGGLYSHQVRTYEYGNIISDFRSPTRLILKLHGCITEASSIILDRRSYFDGKSKNAGMYDAVQALCTVSTVLFLGYSMNDPDIQLILETIHSRSWADHRHFALVPKFEHPSLRLAHQHTYNIEFVEYPAGRHELVPAGLGELRSAVQATRASTGARV